MKMSHPSLILTALFISVIACRAEEAQEAKKSKSKSTQFVRIRTSDDDEPIAMETAIVRYVTPAGKEPQVVVDLIGVIHIGDKDYYEKLNKIFTRYDALLYELVAPKDARPKPGGKRKATGVLSGVQRGMKNMLELEFQLDHIDYTKKNFVHADMSPKEFSEAMTERGESFLQMFFKSIGHSAALQAKDPERYNDANMLFALFAKDRAQRMKRLMARQFEDMETMTMMFSGPNSSTIITERNKKALEVMDGEIAAGKKRIGIFYGAGHLPDLEKRLINDYGMKVKKVNWVRAWSLQAKEPVKKKPVKKSEVEKQ